jgi:hypothetical protein
MLTAVYNGPLSGSRLWSLEALARNDYECQIDLHRSQRGRVARLPFLQEGTAGTQVQAAGLADQHYSLLVPSLPMLAEHF